MSEKNCPDCGHYIDVHKGCQHPGCPCTRTYESLVGFKYCPCNEWRSGVPIEHRHPYVHHFNCDGTGKLKTETQMETELELIVIDMGDSCVVKVEKGEWDAAPFVAKLSCTALPKSFLFGISFTALREAIDGETPIPRLFVLRDSDESKYGIIHSNTLSEVDVITQTSYDALSELAGKPLPVWTGGTWEEVGHIDDDVYNNTDLRVWRYKR